MGANIEHLTLKEEGVPNGKLEVIKMMEINKRCRCFL